MYNECAKEKYTELKEANEIIKNDLHKIKKRILERCSGVETILLFGGFATGEGSAIITDKGIKPLNDYDILVVTKHPNLKIPNVNFGLNVRVDCSFIWKRFLNRVPKQLMWYDIKFGSKILHGKSSILNKIPITSSKDIRKKEALRLLFNRMAGMLLYIRPIYLVDGIPTEQKFKINYEACKCLIGCMDSVLIINGKYRIGLEKRLEEFKELKDRPESVSINDISRAVKFKLRPRNNFIDSKNFWFNARDAIIETTKFQIQHLFPDVNVRPVLNIDKYFDNCKFAFTEYLIFNLRYLLRIKRVPPIFYRKRFLDTVGILLFLLLSAITKTGVDEKTLEFAYKLASRIFGVCRRGLQDVNEDWCKLRNTLLYLRSMVHQG